MKSTDQDSDKQLKMRSPVQELNWHVGGWIEINATSATNIVEAVFETDPFNGSLSRCQILLVKVRDG